MSANLTSLRSVWLGGVAWLGWVVGFTAHADVPVPANVVNPPTVAEAWNVLRLAADNVGMLLQEGRLSEIAVQISLCSPALRTLDRLPLTAEQGAQLSAQAALASRQIVQTAQAANAQNKPVAEAAYAAFKATLADMGKPYGTKIATGDIYICPMHPDFASVTPSIPCERCGMHLMIRRIPYSFIYRAPGEPSIRLTASTEAPLQVGHESKVRLKLATLNGKPVTHSDLVIVHTQPIHLLIVDASLSDYHHVHPLQVNRLGEPIQPVPAIEGALCGPPPGVPGEYVFSFTPRKPGAYRIFADLVPTATGIQEYAMTDLPGEGISQALTNKGDAFVSEVDGLKFNLTLTGRAQARQARYLKIAVTEADGTPLRRLEPVMNTFAHLVGFYDDGHTVVHMHPEGGDILRQEARGGPALGFKIYPPKAGFLRLYCQVQVGGRMIFAPFNLNVAE